jgi:phage gp16-like protein
MFKAKAPADKIIAVTNKISTKDLSVFDVYKQIHFIKTNIEKTKLQIYFEK